MRLEMGVDGTMVKGKGAVVQYALLSEEERLVFDTEMRRILRDREDDEYEDVPMGDFPYVEEGEELVSFDTYGGWRWTTAFWVENPEMLFEWGSLTTPWRRPKIIKPRSYGKTEEDHSYTPFFICLNESKTAAAEAAERIRRYAPGIAAILDRRGPAVEAGDLIAYTTS